MLGDQRDDGPGRRPLLRGHPVAAVPNKKKAARFLMQATFGPRYDEVAALEGNDFAGWIAAQMALDSIIASSPLQKKIAPAADVRRCISGELELGRDERRRRGPLRPRLEVAQVRLHDGRHRQDLGL